MRVFLALLLVAHGLFSQKSLGYLIVGTTGEDRENSFLQNLERICGRSLRYDEEITASNCPNSGATEAIRAIAQETESRAQESVERAFRQLSPELRSFLGSQCADEEGSRALLPTVLQCYSRWMNNAQLSTDQINQRNAIAPLSSQEAEAGRLLLNSAVSRAMQGTYAFTFCGLSSGYVTDTGPSVRQETRMQIRDGLSDGEIGSCPGNPDTSQVNDLPHSPMTLEETLRVLPSEEEQSALRSYVGALNEDPGLIRLGDPCAEMLDDSNSCSTSGVLTDPALQLMRDLDSQTYEDQLEEVRNQMKRYLAESLRKKHLELLANGGMDPRFCGQSPMRADVDGAMNSQSTAIMGRSSNPSYPGRPDLGLSTCMFQYGINDYNDQMRSVIGETACGNPSQSDVQQVLGSNNVPTSCALPQLDIQPLRRAGEILDQLDSQNEQLRSNSCGSMQCGEVIDRYLNCPCTQRNLPRSIRNTNSVNEFEEFLQTNDSYEIGSCMRQFPDSCLSVGLIADPSVLSTLSSFRNIKRLELGILQDTPELASDHFRSSIREIDDQAVLDILRNQTSVNGSSFIDQAMEENRENIRDFRDGPFVESMASFCEDSDEFLDSVLAVHGNEFARGFIPESFRLGDPAVNPYSVCRVMHVAQAGESRESAARGFTGGVLAVGGIFATGGTALLFAGGALAATYEGRTNQGSVDLAAGSALSGCSPEELNQRVEARNRFYGREAVVDYLIDGIGIAGAGAGLRVVTEAGGAVATAGRVVSAGADALSVPDVPYGLATTDLYETPLEPFDFSTVELE